MRLSKIVRAAAILAAVTLGIITPAKAETADFPQVPTLTYGGWCWTNIRTWAQTRPDWPGRAIINIQALPVQGIGPGRHPFAPLCNVLTTVAWRNTITGAQGAYQTIVVTGIYGSLQYSVFQPTGPGHIEIDVTTNNASIPAHASFEVPAQPGP